MAARLAPAGEDLQHGAAAALTAGLARQDDEPPGFRRIDRITIRRPERDNRLSISPNPRAEVFPPPVFGDWGHGPKDLSGRGSLGPAAAEAGGYYSSVKNARLSIWALLAVFMALGGSRAGAAEVRWGRPAGERIKALGAEVDDASRFKAYAEGSRSLGAGAGDPAALVLIEFSGQAVSEESRLSPTLPGFRPSRGGLPPMPALAPPLRNSDGEKRPAFPVAGLGIAALVALGCLAWRGSRSSGPVCSPMPAPEASISSPDVPIVMTVSPPPAATSLPAREPFIDTRMPVPTWRAISQREQELIESWDGSTERALGRASFEEWLDAQGRVEGVDAARLKVKLRRDGDWS